MRCEAGGDGRDDLDKGEAAMKQLKICREHESGKQALLLRAVQRRQIQISIAHTAISAEWSFFATREDAEVIRDWLSEFLHANELPGQPARG